MTSHVDLAAMPGPELRSLLDSTRRRGDAKLSYEILQEMAQRRERGEPARATPFRKRRHAAPHLVSVDLGDPLDRPDPLDFDRLDPNLVDSEEDDIPPLPPEPLAWDE